MLFDVNVKLVFHNATHATYLQLFCENATVFDSFARTPCEIQLFVLK